MNPERLRRFPAALVVLSVFCLASASAAEKSAYPIPEGKAGKGRLKIIQGIPVMFLQGTPEELGREQGALIGNSAKPLLAYPKTFLKKVGQERRWPFAVAAGKLLLLNLNRDHRTELQSAIAASKLDAESIIVANTMLELRRMGGCSSIVVGRERSKTGNVLFGRNFDFPPLGLLDKYGIVTVYKPKGKRAFVSIGYPGLFGVTSGMNDAGLCVATLDVYSTKDGSPRFDPNGKPMMFTFRRVLEECKNVKEAEALLRKSKPTTWMNLTVCDPSGGVVFELTPKSVVTRKPINGIVSCTNHFRSDKLCTSKECRRYDALFKSQQMKTLGLKNVQKLLHDANQGTMTVQTMIFEPASLKLHVSLTDPPTSNKPLKTLDVKRLLAGAR